VSPESGRDGRSFLGEKSGVGKAVIIILAEDDVVENADAEDLRGFNQAVGAVAVFPRGSRISRRMVMQEHNGRRGVQQCCLEAFPWMNDRCRQAADTYGVVANGSVLRIKGNKDKMLAIKCREFLRSTERLFQLNRTPFNQAFG